MGPLPRRIGFALLSAFEALPHPVRRTIGRLTAGLLESLAWRFARYGWLPRLAVSARLAAGATEQAAFLARRLGTSPRTARRARRQLAWLALRNGWTDAARVILATIPEARHPHFEMVRAKQAMEEGRYEAARGYAQSALGGGSPDAARYLDMIAARVAVLEPGWTPDLGETGPAFRTMHGSAVRGRVLHVVSRALPYHQVGYTLRSQSIGESQLAAGLEPQFATIGNFPANVGVTAAPRDWNVRGVPYHRLAPGFHRQRLPRPDGGRERSRRPGARGTAPAGGPAPGVEPPAGTGRAGHCRATRDSRRLRGARLHRGNVGVTPGT